MTVTSRAALALALVVVLAGCSGVVEDLSPTPVPTGTDSSPAGTDSSPAATSTRPDATSTDTRTQTEPAPTTVRTGSGESPWGDTVVVAVEGSGTRDYAAFVRRATAYWEGNDTRYLGFEVDYDVRPDAADPDLVVRFVDDVPDCGGRQDAVGCAPFITDARQITRPVTVYVQTGLSDSSSALVTAHELGHTLGLTHEDPPHDVMRAETVLYTTPQPNATEREFPWTDAEFTVRIDTAGASDPDGSREQVGHALDYYRDAPEGMPSNLTFTVTDATDAEILIRLGDCGPGAGSCVQTRGPDPDGDGAIETYSRLIVTLDDVDTDAVGWHVGYWLAYGFGAEADADKPDPFRDASYDERRSEWWR